MKRIFPVLAVLFLGYLGFSLALPLFPPLFLESTHSFFPEDTSEHMRRILLGILFAMYPIGQFIGAPILGKLSDKYGRKPILLISLVMVIPSFIGSAIAVLHMLPILLYFSRFFSGLLEGNIVIAQAAIADISEDARTKTKHFGWLVSLGSTAFFFGPLIGGSLADSSVVHWFHYDTPFWCAALLSLIAFLIVYAYFTETHQSDRAIKISARSTIRSFLEGLKYKRLRTIFAANFVIFLAMFFFLNFFSPYLVNRFGFSFVLLGQVNAYLSLPFIIGPMFFKILTKWWTPKQILCVGSLLICISTLIFVIPSSPWALLITIFPVGFSLALGFAFPAIMVSEAVGKRYQGHALGTNQSLQVFAEAFTALIGGFIMAVQNSLPIYIGALCALFGTVILMISGQQVKSR